MKYKKEWLADCEATEKDIKEDGRGGFFIMVEVTKHDDTYQGPSFYDEFERKHEARLERGGRD